MFKKISLSVLFVAITTLLVFGQAGDAKMAKKNLKIAQKALGQYNLDNKANSSKLEEGIVAIEEAIQNSEVGGSATAYLVQGQLYNSVGNRDLTMPLIDPEWKSVDYSVGMKSYQAFNKALEVAEKKFETEDALKGLFEAVQHLNNKGIEYYNEKDFKNAYTNFAPILGIHKTLKDTETPSPLDDAEKLKSQMFIHAYTSLKSERVDEAEDMYNQLKAMDSPESNVFEGLYEIYTIKGDDAEAEKVLFEGVKAYPEDSGLLFAQINHFLKLDKTDELIDKLELAIEKEPSNVTLYATLGNVHERLQNDAITNGDLELAKTHFDKAIKNYTEATKVDPDYAAAVYSIGALYYNQGANKTNELNELANDYSKEGTAKYEQLKEDINGIFDLALPYFKKAEKIDPNDINTLIALKEIFARKNDFDTSNEFKARMEKVQAGEKNSESYFN